MVRSLLALIAVVIALVVYSDRHLDRRNAQVTAGATSSDQASAPTEAAHLAKAPREAFQSTSVKIGPVSFAEGVRRVSDRIATAHPSAPFCARPFPPARTIPLLI